MLPRRIKYIELVRELNSGGTAKVYFGIDTRTGFPVAVKQLDPSLLSRPNMKELFKSEANAYLYLDHPNIVKLTDYFEEGYLILEYIEGKNLREYMKSVTGPSPISQAALFVNEVLKAIAYAHKNDRIHMDIKPANIMLSDVKDEIKVIDFGISVDLREKQIREIMGTPYYMSPEQTIPGRSVDERTDIYALGITLFELVMGRPPFAELDLSREELLVKIRTETLPQATTRNQYGRHLIQPLNNIIKKATAKDPDDRYQTCESFQEALATLL